MNLTRLEDFDKYEDVGIVQIDSVTFGNTLRNMLYEYQCRSRNLEWWYDF
jgi:hypothetical protein